MDGVVFCRFETPIDKVPPCLTKLSVFTIKFTQGPGDVPDMKDVIQVGKALKVKLFLFNSKILLIKPCFCRWLKSQS